MKIVGYNYEGNLTAVEFASIYIDKFHGVITDNTCRLHLGGYTYTQYYGIIRQKEREDGTLALTKKEAEAIIRAVISNECLELTAMGDYKIVSGTQWETVFIRNDVNEFDDEDIPILISVADDQ